MDKKDTIHVCYAMVDKSGNYSKFTGAAICSLFANTTSAVIVHLLYDGQMTEANRAKFAQLAERYGQEIRLCNVQTAIPKTWAQAGATFAESLNAERYTGANMYRLAIPELLPDVHRAIYLDADTIVNMDIAELWQEDIGESGLAAVPDIAVLEHFGRQDEVAPSQSFLYTECQATVDTVFNAGVLLMDLDRLRDRESNLLLEGVAFLKAHAEKFEFYDNDILIAFFAQTFTHLSWHYNIRLEWAQQFGRGQLVPGIYHYLGRNYGLNPAEPHYRMFLTYWGMSPWFNPTVLWHGYRVTVDNMQAQAKERLVKVRRIYNLCCRKQRVFVGLAMDEQRLRADFALGEDEPYMALAPGGQLRLPYDTATHAYIFFWSNYAEIKNLLENAGKKEYEDFADGTRLLEGQIDDLRVSEQTVMWNI